MGRPIYPYELSDPDFAWLLSNFQENRTDFHLIDTGCLPVVLVKLDELMAADDMTASNAVAAEAKTEDDLSDVTEK